MPPDRVTVVTSCTNLKREVRDTLPAEGLYAGQQHLRLMRGVRALRGAGTSVDVWIISAGHGVVHGSEPLAPYDRTFQGRPTAERRAMANDLDIPNAVRRVLGEPTQLAVVALSEDYLDVCGLSDDLRPGGPLLFVCSASAALRVPAISNATVLALRTGHTRSFHCGYVGLKGEVVGRLLWALAEDRIPSADALDARLLSVLAAQGPVEPLTAQTLI